MTQKVHIVRKLKRSIYQEEWKWNQSAKEALFERQSSEEES